MLYWQLQGDFGQQPKTSLAAVRRKSGRGCGKLVEGVAIASHLIMRGVCYVHGVLIFRK